MTTDEALLRTFRRERNNYEQLQQQSEKMRMAIEKHLPALRQMAGQVIHPADNTFSRMTKDFEEAIKP